MTTDPAVPATVEPETWVSWTDEGIFIACRKPSCMTDGHKSKYNPEGRYIGHFEIPGYYLLPKDIDKAFMEHKVAHS